ncbi:MAG: DNA repair protein RadA [Flavobacteriales bacterium]|jgi:DNA repair protein RadA/Sms
MAKTKTAFFCQNCGTQSPKWIGKCPSCSEWNTFVEEVLQKESAVTGLVSRKPHNTPKPVHELDTSISTRIELHDAELNRVLGGGLVPGSLILFGGEPGIGKSTLMLQLALAEKDLSILYVSGEESEDQIKMRAERLGMNNPRCMVLMETSLSQILGHMEDMQPGLVIIDSIQTLQSELVESFPGSVSQVRECATRLLQFAKEHQTPIFLIGHITKEGSLAGPKVLEHMVDAVLQFEGDRQHIYRILRTTKNRFGSTHELGIYEMQAGGLRIVENPSEILIRPDDQSLSGSAIAAALEGMRPLLIEIQALASTAVYGTPQRSTTGFDIRRLNMLLAVLEKRCGFRLGMKDVFLNIAGGMRLEDPAMDLAVISAVLSSSEDLALPKATCFAGEVGLSGEIRPVARMEQRIQEASRLGFERMYVARPARGELPKVKGMQVITVSRVDELFRELFG